ISSDVERKLSLHLSVVSRFERKQAADKVVKHMLGFQDLIQHQLANNAISDKAFSYLDTEAIHLIETWNENDWLVSNSRRNIR
uniref:FIMAH domain-containing protein n=1 Tax=Virgibacillus salexigens TaxID=61016 RepID=UPI003F82ADDC